MSVDYVKFKHPFSCTVSVLRHSCKSSFCLRRLQKLDSLYTEPEIGGGIIWCYSGKPGFPKRQQLPPYTTYHEGVPENFGGGVGKLCLVILDDLLNDVYSNQVCDLFTRGSHHRNISVILITQNLFLQGRFCREISQSAHYLVALKGDRGKKEFMYFANQGYP